MTTENDTIVGVPPFALLPAKNYMFKINDNNYVIRIPRNGTYHDIDPEFFSEETGGFDILDANNVLFLPAIVKVLFATKQYPELKFNQLFVPTVLKIEETEVVIVGQVVEMLVPLKPDNEIAESV